MIVAFMIRKMRDIQAAGKVAHGYLVQECDATRLHIIPLPGQTFFSYLQPS